MTGRSLVTSVILVVVVSLMFGAGAFAAQDAGLPDALEVAWQDGVKPGSNGPGDCEPNDDCDQDQLRLVEQTQDQLQLKEQLRDGSCDGSGTGSANGNNGDNGDGGNGGDNSGGNGGGNGGGKRG